MAAFGTRLTYLANYMQEEKQRKQAPSASDRSSSVESLPAAPDSGGEIPAAPDFGGPPDAPPFDAPPLGPPDAPPFDAPPMDGPPDAPPM